VFAQSGDAKLYWESAGSGDPVLLIMGLGMAATGWWRTVPVLAEGLRVIAFDNRGVGRSDRTTGPYSLRQMAEDTVAVMDAAKLKRASVYGLSLGAMIAQYVALRYPDRVRALVLGASTAGGSTHELPEPEVMEFLRRRPSMPAEEAIWASVPYNYGTATRERHADRIGEDIAQRLRFPINPAGYRAQLAAAWGFDARDRLHEVSVPTLVLHGDEDRIVPLANGEMLAAAIPGAQLETLEGAGHIYPTDVPEADREVLRFLTGSEMQRARARGARA
jgi:pimeloyl-ACP methyl ester carboxylesterase